MATFYIIGDVNDSSFVRIAATQADATEMVDWLSQSADHSSGSYSYALENIQDTHMILLFAHAASVDLSNFRLDIAAFSGKMNSPK